MSVCLPSPWNILEEHISWQISQLISGEKPIVIPSLVCFILTDLVQIHVSYKSGREKDNVSSGF